MMRKIFNTIQNIISILRCGYIEKTVDIPLSEKFVVPEWFRIAEKEIGTREIINGENPRIIEYHMVTSLKAREDEVPWCASFVCWCLERSNIKSPRSARALDFLIWGDVQTTPLIGSIVVFKRGNVGGHVGLYVGQSKNTVLVLGGNQSNCVNISEYNKNDLLGYRWPKV